MEFLKFKKKLANQIGQNVSNSDAQQLMSPFKNGNRNVLLEMNKTPRMGGVMLLVYNKDQKAHFTLIRRPEYDGVHSGQIALPGGQMDKEDNDIQDTALRETFEEVGVFASKIQVLGQISQVYIPPSKFLVTPFIGIMDEYPSFIKDDYEVAEVLEVPISLLFDDSIIKSGPVNVGKEGYTMKVPYFDIFGHKVWGATAIMLSEFKAIMK